MSTEEGKKRMKCFERNIKKAINKTKSEELTGVEITAAMGRRVIVSKMQKHYRCPACEKDPTHECSAQYCALAAFMMR